MHVLLDSLNVVSELIPDIAPEFPSVPIEQRYTPEFVARLIHVDDSVEVHQNWMYNPEDGTFYEPDELPRPAPTPHIYTDLEKAQQEITDRELDIIEQGQQVTDLELLSITQNQVINVMTGGNINDNL